MATSNKNITCVSCDLKLDSNQWDVLWCVLREKFPDSEFEEIQLKNLCHNEYRKQSKKWDSVVVLFGGYNIKRYYYNCWLHLISFKGPLYGLNIEGKLFDLPRIYSITSIIRFEFKKFILSTLANTSFKLFLRKSKTGDIK